MHRLKEGAPSPAMIVSIIALIVALGGTAYAATKITTKDIAANAVTSPKVKNKTLKKKDFSKSVLSGLKGPKGDKGDTGETGPQGPVGPSSPATYTNPEWGPIHRNTIGSPFQALVGGPIVGTAADEKPPFGVGSLSLEVEADASGAGANPNNFGTEKAAWGNQVDFANQNVSDLTALGFRVFQTGENASKGNPNMPSIAIEIDPNLTATPSNFSTLTWLPEQSPVTNKWSGYLDATTTPANPSGTGFILSGAAGTATGCVLATPCTFAGVKTALAAGTGAKILTLGITKGRDYGWQGAVDGLRVNGTVYDFEPFGVQETTP